MGEALKLMAYRTGSREAMEEVHALMAEMDTDKPTASDLEKLRGLLKKHPKLWESVGRVPEMAAESVLRKRAGKNPAMAESALHGAAEIKRDLGYDEAPALEAFSSSRSGCSGCT